MTGRARCSQACEECKRRKERCDGQSPCLLCTRRNRTDACIFSTTDTLQTPPCWPRKRRRVDDVILASTEGRVPVSVRPAFHGLSHGQKFFSGSSGSLAFPKTVGTCAESAVPHHTFITSCQDDFFVQEVPNTNQIAASRLELSGENCSDLTRAFLDSTRGIFDLFEDDDLLESIADWTPPVNGQATLDSSILLLVLAIGAQERGAPDDHSLGEQLFLDAHRIATVYMLEPASIDLVRAFILLALYLFVVYRRDAAFAHLGVALRASECIGLHRVETFTELPLEDQRVWSRAWKCLRILDVSSCAALGRTLTTRDRQADTSSMTKSPLTAENQALAAEIDSAGMQLCRIAETILVEVYEKDDLTAQLAYKISQDLRDWTHHLPDILTPGRSDEAEVDQQLPNALCLNSLTEAYYWTIQLLTRPFLLAAIKAKQLEANSLTAVNHHSSSFADACINSAFRCLDVTSRLTQYKRLPKRPFLINNTTLVSALVLGLAFLGDYDQHFTLGSGLQKAKTFLLHMTEDR